MGVWFHQFFRASACLLALVLVFMLALPVPGHAAVATVQDAERMEDPDLNDGGSGGSLFLPDYNAVNQIPFATSRAGYTDITNTIVKRENIYGTIAYNGNWLGQTVFMKNDGHWVKVISPNSTYMNDIVLWLNKTVLPPSGKYKFRVGFSSDLSHDSGIFSRFLIELQKETDNASSVYSVPYAFNSAIHDDGAGGFYTDFVNIDLSNVTRVRLDFYLNEIVPPEAGGFFRFEWVPVSSFSSGDVAEPPLSYNAEDTQQSIANSVSQIPGALYQTSGYIQQVNATLLEVINTISMQLNALWNQMFNYMHVPMLAQVKDGTQQIVDAINDIYIDFSEFNKEIISNDNRLHQEQLANDNQNTDTMVNGYDNSGMESSNSKLSQSMQEYESQESQLLGSVQGHIDGFEYKNPFDQFTAPLADVSFMLTGIYTGFGALNIPIAFSLTLSIGLICIGWYRFKGG